MDYYRWDAIDAPGYAHWSGGYSLHKQLNSGTPFGAKLPTDVIFDMNRSFPKDRLVADVFEVSSVVVVSARLATYLRAQLPAGTLEFVPVTLRDHAEQVVATDHVALHALHTFDAIDIKASKVKWHPLNKTRIYSCAQIVVRPELIPPHATMFRLKHWDGAILLPRALAWQIAGAGFTGVMFSSIRDFAGYSTDGKIVGAAEAHWYPYMESPGSAGASVAAALAIAPAVAPVVAPAVAPLATAPAPSAKAARKPRISVDETRLNETVEAWCKRQPAALRAVIDVLRQDLSLAELPDALAERAALQSHLATAELKPAQAKQLRAASKDLEAHIPLALWLTVRVGKLHARYQTYFAALPTDRVLKISKLAYQAGTFVVDFRDGPDEEMCERAGDGYRPLAMLRDKREPLYAGLAFHPTKPNAPIYLVEPSGDPELVASNLDEFAKRLK